MNYQDKTGITEKEIDDWVEQHSESLDRRIKFVNEVVNRLEFELRNRAILAKVSGRVKSISSLREKLVKWSQRSDKIEILRKNGLQKTVGDLAAVRVMTYVESDRGKIVDLIGGTEGDEENEPVEGIFEQASPFEKKEDDKRIKDEDTNYYRATHVQIKLRQKDLQESDNLANLKLETCELQITSMLAHVWNEIEHDISYKADKRLLSEKEKSAIKSLGMLTQSGDNIIAGLIEVNRTRLSSRKINSEGELSEFISDHFGEVKYGRTTLDFYKNITPVFTALKHLESRHLVTLELPTLREIITPKRLLKAFYDCRELAKFMKESDKIRNVPDESSADVVFVVLMNEYLSYLLARNISGKRKGMTFASQYKLYLDKEQKKLEKGSMR